MKIRLISSATLLFASMALSSVALAESPVCSEGQNDSWMQPDMLQEKVETMGYVIENMGISEGNCYEVTGMNGQGQSVTAYLDPITGDVVQEDVAQ